MMPQVYWLSSVRPDGRPHVTPVLGVWLDGALYFCTDPIERKAGNLAQNARCVLTTGRNTLDNGLDLVVEGEAAEVSDEAELRSVAEAFESKYGSYFTAPEGTWFGLGDTIRAGNALVYRIAPSTAFGFGKGEQFARPGGVSPELQCLSVQSQQCPHIGTRNVPSAPGQFRPPMTTQSQLGGYFARLRATVITVSDRTLYEHPV